MAAGLPFPKTYLILSMSRFDFYNNNNNNNNNNNKYNNDNNKNNNENHFMCGLNLIDKIYLRLGLSEFSRFSVGKKNYL